MSPVEERGDHNDDDEDDDDEKRGPAGEEGVMQRLHRRLALFVCLFVCVRLTQRVRTLRRLCGAKRCLVNVPPGNQETKNRKN